MLKSIPEGDFWAMNVKNSPTLFSAGDEGKWARVKMVQGKHPIPSFSAKAGNPEIHSAKNGPPALRLFLKRGDDVSGRG